MFKGDFIAGQFQKPLTQDGEFKDFCPGRIQDCLGTVSFSRDHIDIATESAKKAYKTWSKLTVEERTAYLLKLKDIFIANKDLMALAIARDTGKPLWEAQTEATALASKIDITLRFSLPLVKTELVPQALPDVDGVIRYKSRGVMAVLGPFNFPAHLPNGHIIPALIMGNTIVFKPSEQTPFVAQVYADCIQQAQLPSGVFNMVQGDGESGRKLILNEAIDGILFTGSYEVGLKIKQDTLTHYWKLLALEMGGKNATVVWNDADLDKAVYESIIGSYLSAGQRCSGTSRIYVHQDCAEEFTQKFYALAKKLSIGYFEDNPFMGPLINQASVEKYLRFQEIAKRENCEPLMRGKILENTKYPGHYVTPSINLVQKFNPDSIYHKNEIFGPNVSICQVSDFDEATSMVNSTGFGLVAALFTKNRSLYEKAFQDYRVGLLNWNRTTNGASSKLPFGGMGKSGNDRPSAHFAIQYCCIPVASLEDTTTFNPDQMLPGMS
jgi:succinylglutamic semialdehyde dehydrogenase